MPQGKDIEFSDEDFLKSVKESFTFKEVAIRLGYKVESAAASQGKLHQTFLRLKPDISHFNMKSLSHSLIFREKYHCFQGIYNQIKFRHNKRFEKGTLISIEEAEQICLMNCFYCGQEPYQSPLSVFRYRNKINGIDRIDTSKGYISENCVAACRTCNTMKLNHTVKFMYEHMGKILTYHGYTIIPPI